MEELKREKAEKAAKEQKKQALAEKNAQQRKEREKREAEEQMLAAGDGDLYSMLDKLTAGNPRAERLFAARMSKSTREKAGCQPPPLLESFDLQGVAKLISSMGVDCVKPKLKIPF